MATKPRRVAVIGAGAGGLSAARHLVEAGHRVSIYERHTGRRALVYDNDNGLSAASRSPPINSEPRVTHFRDYPFPSGTPIFPSHEQVIGYLSDFADDFDLRRRIRFASPVESVSPVDEVPGPGWLVRTAQGARRRTTTSWSPRAIRGFLCTPPGPTSSPASTCTRTPTGSRSGSAASECWSWASATAVSTPPTPARWQARRYLRGRRC